MNMTRTAKLEYRSQVAIHRFTRDEEAKLLRYSNRQRAIMDHRQITVRDVQDAALLVAHERKAVA